MLPKAVLDARRKREKIFLIRCCKSLLYEKLSIKIPCRKYFKKIHLYNGNSDFFTIFAIPKIGFFWLK